MSFLQKENLRKMVWEQRSDGVILKEICFFSLFQLKPCCCDPAVSCVRICFILFRGQSWGNVAIVSSTGSSWGASRDAEKLVGGIVSWVAQLVLRERSRKPWNVVVFIISCNLHNYFLYQGMFCHLFPRCLAEMTYSPATILIWVEG